MAISTVHTYLGFAKITDSTEPTEYTKLTDIKDYSDLASPPEAIPTTTMSDVAETSIPGVIYISLNDTILRDSKKIDIDESSRIWA